MWPVGILFADDSVVARTSVLTSCLPTQDCSNPSLTRMSQALPALRWPTFTFWHPTHAPVPHHLRHRPPAAEDRRGRLVPLLSHPQLLHARECQASAETPVRHQPKLCKASAEHVLSCFSRRSTIR